MPVVERKNYFLGVHTGLVVPENHKSKTVTLSKARNKLKKLSMVVVRSRHKTA